MQKKKNSYLEWNEIWTPHRILYSKAFTFFFASFIFGLKTFFRSCFSWINDVAWTDADTWLPKPGLENKQEL